MKIVEDAFILIKTRSLLSLDLCYIDSFEVFTCICTYIVLMLKYLSASEESALNKKDRY